ncbi:MAG: GNAT family N-acetyltransferase [Sphingobium sp.]
MADRPGLLATTDLQNIAGLEERALNAWPCVRSVMDGGWVLRLSGGYTKRANSANALHPRKPFAEIVAAAEQFYPAHGLPTVFRLSPLAPSEADALLAQRGYALRDPSHVLTASLKGFAFDAEGEVASALPQAWLEGFARANGQPEPQRVAHERLVGLIALPCGFATIRRDGEAVAFGMAVLEGGDAGLFDIVVSPGHRGQGLGRAVTATLLGWAAVAGAERAYLQVHRDNRPALNLYGSLGFRAVYDYHYRVAPAGP